MAERVAWELRRATVGDLGAIMAIEAGTFGTDAWTPRGMRSELENRQTFYLVAFRPEYPGFIEGYAGLFAPRGSHEADIQTIAVADTARRGGLGRLLMQTLIAEARDRGADQVFLEVRADNPGAKRLYDELGFEQIAVRTAYYQPDGVDAIVMRFAVEPATGGTTTAESG